jgi:hypothetical protein
MSSSCPTGTTVSNILTLASNDNILSDYTVDAQQTYDIDSLYNRIIPRTNDTAENIRQEKALLIKIGGLIDYYNVRYKCAIEMVKEKNDAYMDAASALNRRLKVLTELYNIIKSNAGASAGASAGADAHGDKDYERMIEYTREKAKATNNLMQLYGFLNIVALGVIFYVYRST